MSVLRILTVVGALGATLALTATAGAAVYRVAPVTLEIPAGSGAGILTITNVSDQQIVLQVRVFRWTQSGGQDVLTPTADVVASPPATSVPPGAQHLVRVVRVTNRPLASEEAYRLLIDEIPDAKNAQPQQIKLLLRQSIPAFFGGGVSAPADLQWQVVRTTKGVELAAQNHGTRRYRISELSAKDAAGATLTTRSGLAGYVLAGSETRWSLNDAAAAGPIAVSATSEAGPVHVVVAATQTP
jgi:fimbrial chaperone protein